MSIVVESVSAVATNSASSSLTITKPTGLSVGDLLVASISIYTADGAPGTTSWDTLSGWSLATSLDAGGDVGLSIQYKIADAGDVAASNFTFTASATADLLVGQLLRCSGHAPLDQLVSASTYSNNTADSATFAATHSAFTPAVDGALVIIQVSGIFSTGSTNRTTSAYTTTNVSYTEGYDVGANDGSGGSHTAMAYGIQSTAAEISAYGATFNTSTPDHYGQIAIFTAPVDASAENTLVTTDTTLFAQSGACDGVGGNNLLATDTTLFSQSGKGTSPQQWTNGAKNSASWTNPDK